MRCLRLFCSDDPLPRVDYTSVENQTWGTVYRKLSELFPTHACSQYRRTLQMLDYSLDKIPQLQEVNEKLKSTSIDLVCTSTTLVC
jgi:phenylalanine-4-hydroxylase